MAPGTWRLKKDKNKKAKIGFILQTHSLMFFAETDTGKKLQGTKKKKKITIISSRFYFKKRCLNQWKFVLILQHGNTQTLHFIPPSRSFLSAHHRHQTFFAYMMKKQTN